MIVGIVGTGYVGLPLAVAFAESGHRVIAMDTDPRKVAALEAGESYIEDIPSAALAAVSDRIEATTRVGPLAQADAVLICVPTPLTANREPDLGPLVDATSSLARVLRAGQLVVLESTTYPGTTRERLVPLLEESGLAAGTDFSLAFSPERVDPGNETHTIRNTPKVVGGLTEVCTQRATDLYSAICDEIVPVSTPEAAELTKLLENIFRSVNIALVNELALLADRMDIDIWEVVDAAGDQAVRVHALRARAGDGRPLPARRPVLPCLARARVRLSDRVHRARREDQPRRCPTTAWRRSSARSTTPASRFEDRASRSSGSPTRRASGTRASRPR